MSIPQKRVRRGASTAGAATRTLLAGGVLATSVAIGPRFLRAGSDTGDQPTALAASDPAHQEVIDGLAGLLSRSRSILAIHPRGETPFVEVVVWLKDENQSGLPNPDEVVVIAHSRLLGVVALYALREDPEAKPGGFDVMPTWGSDFCATWRDRIDVERRPIATNVRELEVREIGAASSGETMLEITLSWGSDSTDALDKASVLFDAPRAGRSGP